MRSGRCTSGAPRSAGWTWPRSGHPATLAYTDFLLAAAGLGGLGVLCAAMAPCSRLYAFLGATLAAGGVADGYREWVDSYADPAFEELAGTLERLLDRYAGDGPAVRHAYRRAMELELGFFTAAGDG